ncbi:MAG: VCBS repeat-containing protein [bacterium]
MKKAVLIIAGALIGLGVTLSCHARGVPNDFDGDGASDLAVYNPANGQWFIRSLDGRIIEWQRSWGFSTAYPVPADYDGDGQTDLAVFDRASGNWFITTRSGKILAWRLAWGWNTAVPVPGDYDGDSKDDIGVYDLESGKWYVYSIALQKVLIWGQNWGFKGDVRRWERPPTSTVLPVPYDYDNDGRTDLAVYYRGFSMADTYWYILGTSNKTWATVWGSSGSIPTPGSYRSVVDESLYPKGIAVYKIKYSIVGDGSDGSFCTPYTYQFKLGTYGLSVPVPGLDFDGNGWDDHAVYSAANNGQWIISLNDGDGNDGASGAYEQPPRRTVQWGFQGAIPANIYNTIYTACGYSVKPW